MKKKKVKLPCSKCGVQVERTYSHANIVCFNCKREHKRLATQQYYGNGKVINSEVKT